MAKEPTKNKTKKRTCQINKQKQKNNNNTFY